MNNLKRVVFAASCMMCSLGANAGSGSGKVGLLLSHEPNIVIFALVGTHTDKPPCSSAQWAFSVDSSAGKAMYSTLLAAAALGRTVSVQGTNACTAWADRETPLYLLVDFNS